VKISDGAIIKCNYELCVKVVNKSNIKPVTPSVVTLIQVIILRRVTWIGQVARMQEIYAYTVLLVGLEGKVHL
jgi:hypothetical protein